jgi:hypothetical protein
MSVGTYTRSDYAAVGLRIAEMALAEAERTDCANDEVMTLCDEVIRRRLRVHMAELANGKWPSDTVRARMQRDRMLLIQHSRVIRLPA